MMVYFLRHAEAVPEARTDFDRELSEKGIEQAKAVGRFCADREILPEKIYTSPAIRAAQTAEIVGKRLDIEVIQAPFLTPGMTPERGFTGLQERAEHHACMLVGHEPDFSELIAGLIGLRMSIQLHLRKGSLTAVSVPRMEMGRGVLQFSIPVRYMK